MTSSSSSSSSTTAMAVQIVHQDFARWIRPPVECQDNDRDGLFHLNKLNPAEMWTIFKNCTTGPTCTREEIVALNEQPFLEELSLFNSRLWNDKIFDSKFHGSCLATTPSDDHRHFAFPLMIGEFQQYAPYNKLTFDLGPECIFGSVEIAVCRNEGTVLRVDFAELSVQCGIKAIGSAVTIHTTPIYKGGLFIANVIRSDQEFLMIIKVRSTPLL
jgi:hypothetical protein